ncbi:MAG: cation transporter [Melioribacter sp.]|uniref:heavy-metal-associated domain-containing protein n=1 Tax=Rosettibacter primus TaxID=3111523 RepID=UPI00247E0B05|nr:cation transporter [Melioribacter sp.]
MITKEFIIDGMSCHHCVMAVEKELSRLNLESFEVKIGSAKVTFNESNIKEEEIEKAINNAGYKVRKN